MNGMITWYPSPCTPQWYDNVVPVAVYAADRQDFYVVTRGRDVEAWGTNDPRSRVDHAKAKTYEHRWAGFAGCVRRFSPPLSLSYRLSIRTFDNYRYRYRCRYRYRYRFFQAYRIEALFFSISNTSQGIYESGMSVNG